MKLKNLIGTFLLTIFLLPVKVGAAQCYKLDGTNNCKYAVTVSGACDGTTTFSTAEECRQKSAPACSSVSCRTIERLLTSGNESCTCDADHPRSRDIPVTCWSDGVLSSKDVEVCFDKTAWIEDSDVYGTISAEISGVNNKSLSGLGTFINKIINFILFLAAVLLFINIVLAGIQIITNGKDPKGFSEAMKKILFSVIGILIAAFAYIIADYVMKLFFGDQTEIFNNTSMQLEIKDHRG